MKNYKICLVSSAGGHLNQIKELIDPLSALYDVFLVTLDREDSRSLLKSNIRHYFIRDIRDEGNLLLNFTDSVKIFKTEKPDVVITTGAGAAISLCLLAKLFFRKLIYIESFARVEEPSAFGKLIYRLGSQTLYQWPDLKNFYKKGIYAGSVFNISFNATNNAATQVFVTVGSTAFQFNRLLKEIDNLIETGIINHKVIAQIGNSSYIPKNFEFFDWCSFSQMQELMLSSKYTITHSGTGSVVNALQLGVKVITMPRLMKYNEHLDDHQLEIAKEFEDLGLVMVAYDTDQLETNIRHETDFIPSGSLNNKRFFKELSGILKFEIV